jgi:small subunit ribosomal protein S21
LAPTPTAVEGAVNRVFFCHYTELKEVKLMADVMLREGESQEALLRRFRKKVMRAGVLRDAKKKRWFVSKSEKRRIAKRKAIRKHRRREWRLKSRIRR